MSRGKVAYLLGFVPNPRFNKRMNAAKGRFDVALVCWAKSDGYTFRNVHEGAGCHVVNMPADAFDPVARMRPLAEFAGRALEALREERPDVIHLQGLDMLMIACWYKRRFDRKVHIIYEVADLHRLLVDEQVGAKRRLFARGVAFFERRCARDVDVLVVTSERYFDACYRRFYDRGRVLFVPNAPEGKAFEGYAAKDHSRDFTVGFIGGIRYPDEIRLLVSAAERAGVRVLLAGMEAGDEIRRLCEGRPHVEYLGRYDYDTQIASLYGRCDAIHSVYPAHMKNVRVALPNKLYESVLCGLPIIVAKDTYVGELVEEWGVGVAVEYDSEDELAGALHSLSTDAARYSSLVRACLAKRPEMEAGPYLEKYVGVMGELCDA